MDNKLSIKNNPRITEIKQATSALKCQLSQMVANLNIQYPELTITLLSYELGEVKLVSMIRLEHNKEVIRRG